MAITGKTFVLIHGAWHGAWCYARLARLLRAAGHDVFTPTLTGLGERRHLYSPAINASSHVLDIREVIRTERLEEIVLCGHSYGGLIATAVADAMPEKLAALVFVDGYVGEDDKSILDLDTEAAAAFFMEQVRGHGGHTLPPIPARQFGVNPADQALVDSQCTPQPFATFAERLRLTGAFRTVPRKTYILATGWAGSPFPALKARIAGEPGWSHHSLPCGHDVMLDMPEALAEILLAA